MIDFGLSHFFEPGTKISKSGGTYEYKAPEVYYKNSDEKADIWSIGVCTYYMMTKEYPFP